MTPNLVNTKIKINNIEVSLILPNNLSLEVLEVIKKVQNTILNYKRNKKHSYFEHMLLLQQSSNSKFKISVECTEIKSHDD
jgi:hypothetical protein